LELSASPYLPTWLNWKDPSMSAYTLHPPCFFKLHVAHSFREKNDKSDFYSGLLSSLLNPSALFIIQHLFFPITIFVFSRFKKMCTLFVSYSFFPINEYHTRWVYRISIPRLPDHLCQLRHEEQQVGQAPGWLPGINGKETCAKPGDVPLG
jgi:hypothetical protein